MADAVFLVLLVLHVASIVGWMGGAVFFVSVVSPSLRIMSMASRIEFVLSTFPGYVRFIGGASITAVAAGVLLYGYITLVATSLAPSSSGLIALEVGAVLSLIALIIALGVIIPTARKLVSLAKQMPKPLGGAAEGASPAENPVVVQMTSLQRRLAIGGRLGVSLLGLALILMVVGASI